MRCERYVENNNLRRNQLILKKIRLYNCWRDIRSRPLTSISNEYQSTEVRASITCINTTLDAGNTRWSPFEVDCKVSLTPKGSFKTEVEENNDDFGNFVAARSSAWHFSTVNLCSHKTSKIFHFRIRIKEQMMRSSSSWSPDKTMVIEIAWKITLKVIFMESAGNDRPIPLCSALSPRSTSPCVHKYTNKKHTNTQIHRYTNTQIQMQVSWQWPGNTRLLSSPRHPVCSKQPWQMAALETGNQKATLIWLRHKSYLISFQLWNSGRSAWCELRLISVSLLHRSRSDWEERGGALLVGETNAHHLLWPTEAQLKSNRNFEILLNYPDMMNPSSLSVESSEASIVQKMTFQMASQTCSWRWFVVTVVVWQSFVFHSPLSMNRSLFMWLRIERRLQNVSNSNLPWLLAQWLRRSSWLPLWCIIFFGEDQWHLKRPAPGISRLDLIISESKSPGASREDQLYLTFPETS